MVDPTLTKGLLVTLIFENWPIIAIAAGLILYEWRERSLQKWFEAHAQNYILGFLFAVPVTFLRGVFDIRMPVLETTSAPGIGGILGIIIPLVLVGIGL